MVSVEVGILDIIVNVTIRHVAVFSRYRKAAGHAQSLGLMLLFLEYSNLGLKRSSLCELDFGTLVKGFVASRYLLIEGEVLLARLLTRVNRVVDASCLRLVIASVLLKALVQQVPTLTGGF